MTYLMGYYPYMSNYRCNSFFNNMGYYPYMSNYRYNSFFNNMGYYPYMSNCRCNSFWGNMNYNRYQSDGKSVFWHQGYIDGRKQRISNIANQSLQTLYESQTELLTLINSSELTDAQKKEINKYLKLIQEIQKELLQAMSQSQIAATKQEVDSINNQVEALSSHTCQLLERITKMLEILINEEEDPVDPTDDEDPVTPTDDDSVDDPDDDPPPPADDPKPSAEDGEEIDYEAPIYYPTENAFSKEVKDICKTIDKKVTTFDLFGTNSDLENAIKLINKDNVLDVFNYWNKMYQYKYANKYSTGLVEAIYSEYHLPGGGNGNIKNYILPALQNLVNDMDAKLTNDEKDIIDVCIGNIETELDAPFNTEEETISKNINVIVNILQQKSTQ